MSNLTKAKIEVIHEDGTRQRVALADVLDAFGVKAAQQSKPAAKSAGTAPAPAPETDKKE